MLETYIDNKMTVEASHRYRAVVQDGGLEQVAAYMSMMDGGLHPDHNRVFVLTDTTVDDLYGQKVRDGLDEFGIRHNTFAIAPGEHYKTWNQAGRWIEQLVEQDAMRSDVIVALGGGVVGDLAGFVAATCNRGLRLVQVPTTLLAMVDSSIGGKVGVNHGGKNKAGTTYQPNLIVADPTVVTTLKPRIYNEGFAEVVKTSVVMPDDKLLSQLEANVESLKRRDPRKLGTMIAQCVAYKSKVTADDPYETDPDGGRKLLNYGHTLGHALEAASGYGALLHGEAVAIGMEYAIRLAKHLDVLGTKLYTKGRQHYCRRLTYLPPVRSYLTPKRL